MAKKKKKLTPEQRRRRKIRKLKKRLITIALILTALGAGYYLTNPATAGKASQSEQIATIRDKIITYSQIGQEQAVKVLGIATEYTERALRTTKVPKQLIGGDEEIIVDQVVKNFTEEVKKLPAQQAQKIKTQICQDVIDEATQSANQP